MGYHKNKIKRGVFGEFSKINEEYDELLDAHEQNDKILMICELCDLIGAIEGYAEREFQISLEDIIKFKNKTKNAFINGDRE